MIRHTCTLLHTCTHMGPEAERRETWGGVRQEKGAPGLQTHPIPRGERTPYRARERFLHHLLCTSPQG